MKMKRYIYALVALLMFVSPLYAQENTTGISFFKGTFEEALVKAKQENKPLFVDFYAVWCVPCKKMAKTVFTQEAVGKYFNEHLMLRRAKTYRLRRIIRLLPIQQWLLSLQTARLYQSIRVL